MKIKNLLLILSLTIFASSLSAAEEMQVNVQNDGNIYYDANKYPNGINGIGVHGSIQMAMDANGVMFDQDESFKTRMRLMKELVAKKGLNYTLWAAKKGFSVKSEKKRLQAAGNDHGYCSDAIFMDMAEEANDAYLLQALRNGTLEVVIPNLEVAHLLRILNDNDIRVRVLSNMGDQLLYLQAKNLQAKINSGTLNPQEQTASEFLHTVISDRDHNAVASTLTGNPHKPAAAIYELFLKRNPHHRLTILVDDKLENIEAAVAHGFIGILCKKCKAAAAMREALPKIMGRNIFE